MDTKAVKPAGQRTRRRHDPEFKARVIEACLQPGVSVAAIALANGLNANYLRRWIKEHRRSGSGRSDQGAVVIAGDVKRMTLVPARTESPVARESDEIRIDLRRGATVVQMAWPVAHAVQLGEVLKGLL